MIFRTLFLSLLLFTLPAAAQEKKESTYDRVMRTGTIRCGYGLSDIYLKKDPNTGQLSGIFYDYVEALGKNLGLKIAWTEEIGWGDYITALENNRFDVYCTVVTYNAQRARQVDYLSPLLYLVSDIFVREGDTQFDGHPEKLNSPDVTLTAIEGHVYDKISHRQFPAAKKSIIPQLSNETDLFLNISMGKADAAITGVSWGMEFMEKNPGKIRRVKLASPFLTLPASISVKGGEYRFKRMLEIATTEMMASGAIVDILKKYEKYPGAFLPVAKPYEVRE